MVLKIPFQFKIIILALLIVLTIVKQGLDQGGSREHFTALLQEHLPQQQGLPQGGEMPEKTQMPPEQEEEQVGCDSFPPFPEPRATSTRSDFTATSLVEYNLGQGAQQPIQIEKMMTNLV